MLSGLARPNTVNLGVQTVDFGPTSVGPCVTGLHRLVLKLTVLWLGLRCSHKWRGTAGCGSLYGVLLTGSLQANPVSQGDSVVDDLGSGRRVPGGVSRRNRSSQTARHLQCAGRAVTFATSTSTQPVAGPSASTAKSIRAAGQGRSPRMLGSAGGPCGTLGGSCWTQGSVLPQTGGARGVDSEPVACESAQGTRLLRCRAVSTGGRSRRGSTPMGMNL